MSSEQAQRKQAQRPQDQHRRDHQHPRDQHPRDQHPQDQHSRDHDPQSQPDRASRAEVRDQRLEIRCYSREKELLRRAAELDDRTLSNWLLHVALREARKTIDEHRPTSPDIQANPSPET